MKTCLAQPLSRGPTLARSLGPSSLGCASYRTVRVRQLLCWGVQCQHSRRSAHGDHDIDIVIVMAGTATQYSVIVVRAC